MSTLPTDQCTFLITPRSFLLIIRKVSESFVEKSKHTFYCHIFFFEEIRDIYEIMYKNIVQQNRTQMTVCRMRTALWIPKARNTRSDCAILIAFPPQHWLHKRAPMLCFTYISCLVDSCVSLYIYRNNKVANACAT